VSMNKVARVTYYEFGWGGEEACQAIVPVAIPKEDIDPPTG